MASGAWFGPYAASWEVTVHILRGGPEFPVRWYPLSYGLGPAVWYAVMAVGFAAFVAGCVLLHRRRTDSR